MNPNCGMCLSKMEIALENDNEQETDCVQIAPGLSFNCPPKLCPRHPKRRAH
jgi:hypothetical protein